MRYLVVAVWLAGCMRSNAVECADGTVCPSGKECDSKHAEVCVDPGQLRSCVGSPDGAECTIVTGPDGVCDQEVCVVERCGDGYRRGAEECDGTDTPAADCTDYNFYVSRPLTCTSDCTYDRDSCEQSCGDGMFQPAFEICETDQAPTATCIDYGFGTGVLGCVNCGPETSSCIEFGWRSDDSLAPFFDLHGVSDTEVYAVIGGLYRFDGSTWSKIDLSACGSFFFESVWAVAPGVVFAAGDDTVVRLSGTTCTAWTTANGAAISDVWASSASDAYVITQTNGVWHFDGTAWAQQAGAPATGHTIWGSAANNVYAGDATNRIWRFDGASWSSAQSLPTVSKLNAIWGTSATDVYVGGRNLGDAGQNNEQALVLHFNGATWSPILEDEPVVHGYTNEIQAGWTVGGKVFVVASGADSFRQYRYILEHDGTGWTDLHAPLVDAVALWVSQTGRVFSPQGASQPKVVVLPRAVRIDTPAVVPGDRASVTARAVDDLFVASSGTLLRWDGNEWVAELTGNAARGVSVAPGGDVFVIGSDGLYHQTAQGAWSDPTVTQTGALNGEAVTALAADSVWLIDNAAKMIHRWSSPISISSAPFPATTLLRAIWGVAPSTVIAVGDAGTIATWSGSAFTAAASGTTNPLAAVWGRNASDVYAGGFNILLHFDGVSWSDVPIPQGLDVRGIWGTATEVFFATDRGLLRLVGQELLEVASGTGNPLTAVTGIGDSMFFTDAAGGSHQLVRLSPW